VLAGSIAARCGIRAGDRVLAINGAPIRDEIDYRFAIAEAEVTITVQDGAGRVRTHRISKQEHDDPGLRFHPFRIRRCTNACIFCFYDQMPSGLRPSLYVKDDDYRLSFAHGSFITLTNLREEEYRRIEAQRLSPLYVSVHATSPQVRGFLLGTRRGAEVLPALRRLAAAGIALHTQIVLCPGINDGPILNATLNDLASLAPHVRSIAIVPVGLTRHRKGLYPLRPVSRAGARRALAQVQQWRDSHPRLPAPLVQLADELYLLAGKPFPALRRYGELPQIENGVGLTPLFLKECAAELARRRSPARPKAAAIATGMLAAPLLGQMVAGLNRIPNLSVSLVPVPNSFLGRQVSVAGLLTGEDLLRTVRRARPRGTLYIPASALREDDESFLDGMKLSELARKGGITVRAVPPSGRSLIRTLLE